VDERLSSLAIPRNVTIREAMLVIDRNSLELALVIDQETERLIGTVTDGDIRRALLAGASLGDPVLPHAARRPYTVSAKAGRAEALDLMRAHRISHIPMIDDEGRLAGLHVLRELLGGDELPHVAVIMAGGRGTRLAPLTDHLPKPMVSVAGRPILERLVLHLVGSGIHRIVISVGYLGQMIEEHFGDGTAFGCSIDYLREDSERPLGTAGALGLYAATFDLPTEPLLVMNGDLVTQFDVGDLLDHHGASGAFATVAAGSYSHSVPFGVLEWDARGRLLGLEEKPTTQWSINAGIYVVEPQVVRRIAPGQAATLPALLADCLRRGEPVSVWRLQDEWIDVGQHAELNRARGALS
jgi:dTDP-glucose pyrophosphorylase